MWILRGRNGSRLHSSFLGLPQIQFVYIMEATRRGAELPKARTTPPSPCSPPPIDAKLREKRCCWLHKNQGSVSKSLWNSICYSFVGSSHAMKNSHYPWMPQRMCVALGENCRALWQTAFQCDFGASLCFERNSGEVLHRRKVFCTV